MAAKALFSLADNRLVERYSKCKYPRRFRVTAGAELGSRVQHKR